MKISANTIELLKNFSAINPSILIRQGSVIKTISPQKTVLAEAMVPENFEKTFCIYELGKFISVLSLFKEPELTFGDKQVKISSEKSCVNYTYADPSMIVTSDKTIVLPSEDVNVSLSSDMVQRVIKAVSVLQLPEVALVGDGSGIYFKAVNSKSPISDDFSVQVGETDKEFKVFLKVDNFIKIMPRDYNMVVSKVGFCKFVSDTLFYGIGIEQHSTFS